MKGDNYPRTARGVVSYVFTRVCGRFRSPQGGHSQELAGARGLSTERTAEGWDMAVNGGAIGDRHLLRVGRASTRSKRYGASLKPLVSPVKNRRATMGNCCSARCRLFT